MLNFNQLQKKLFNQRLTLKHLLLLISFIGISLLVYCIAYVSSGFHIVGITLFIVTLLHLCGITLLINHFLSRLHNNGANKKSIILLTHDDELAGQLRYVLPNENILLKRVLTYDNAINILSKKGAYIFIIDIDNKPKNTATLVERCRRHEHQDRRLPIIAIQQSTTAEKKCQLLLEGFDDCLPKPIKQKDINSFYKRWIEDNSHNTSLNDHQQKEIEKTTTNPRQSDAQIPITAKIVDKKQALVQSHQNYDLAKDMLTMLITMIKDNKDTLTQLYEQQQWHELEELTHKIKGGCYCSGVPDLQQAVETIDKALEKGQHEHLDQQFDDLINQINFLIKWDQQYDIDLIFSQS